jgi:hypothetical protein
VKGNLGVDIRCLRYGHGPMRTAHDAKNRIEPTVQLKPPRDPGVSDDLDNANRYKSDFLGIDRRNRIASPKGHSCIERVGEGGEGGVGRTVSRISAA